MANNREISQFAGLVTVNDSTNAVTIGSTLSVSGDLDVNSGGVYYNSTNNRLGINTTSPAASLDVSGDAYFGKSGTAGQIKFRRPLDGIIAASLGHLDSGDNSTFTLQQTGSGAVVRLNASNATGNLRFDVNNTERARIDSSGRLLVGASSASGNSLLQVAGDSSSINESGSIFLHSNYAAASLGGGDGLGIVSAGSSDGGVGASISFIADDTWGAGDYPSRLVFSTTADGASSPTERWKINSVGMWSSGSTTSNFNDWGYISVNRPGLSGGQVMMRLVGTGNFIVRSSGNCENTNNSYGAFSDLKLKENIVDASSQWNDIKDIRVRNFNLKEGQTRKQIGVIAQEIEQVSPGLVTESPDCDAEGNDLGTVTKSVNYSVLYMKAVKALQEAMERIETLEASNADLLARVSVLEQG